MTKPLSSLQFDTLSAIKRHNGCWSLNCGWTYGSTGMCLRTMESLVKRGLLTKSKDEKGRDQYRAKETA